LSYRHKKAPGDRGLVCPEQESNLHYLAITRF
jgi:hypothetical protein